MSLALVGPWAWAELSDPPPGGEPPPGGQPPSPPPPPPPPPPIPEPPSFGWGEGAPLIAVWDADLKLTDSDPGNRAGTCTVYKPGTTTVDRWPFGPVYDSVSQAYTITNPDVWALNDPRRTYRLMQDNAINLYLHDGRAGLAVGYFENGYNRCDWVSLAGLNDHIEAVEGAAATTTTGLVLGRVHEDRVLSTGYTIDGRTPIASDVDFCYYRDWVGRARAEAYWHDHHRLVLVDELTNMLSSPFAIYGGQTTPWGRADLEVLRRMATEVDAAAAGSQRLACDAVWAPIVGDDAVTLGWVPAPESAQAPIELWAKVNASMVPLYLLPSVVLGVPGGEPGGPGSGPAPFVAGESLRMRWKVLPTPMPSPFHGRVKLKYFATTLNNNFAWDGDDITLLASVNGHVEPGATLYVRPNSAVPAEVRKAADLENIYAVEVVIHDPSSPLASLGWQQDTLTPNDVDIVLRARSDTSTSPFALDRAFVVWDVQVVYEDLAGDVLAFQQLDPEAGLGRYTTAAGVEGPCVAPQLCTSNAALRVNDLLDGVTIAQDISALWLADADFDHVPMTEAWGRFIDSACKSLHTTGPGGGPTRCLVDERAWVSDAAAELDNLDIIESFMRLGSGVDLGDGAVVTYLTMEIDDMTEQKGRFSARGPIDPSYPFYAQLPMLSRSMVGEGIVWEVDTGDRAACEGDWVVEWRLPGCPAKWTYGPVADVLLADPDPDIWQTALALADDNPFYDGFPLGAGDNPWACASDVGATTGSVTIPLTEENDGQFRFGWQIKDDTLDLGPGVEPDYRRIDVGDSSILTQEVEMRLVSPNPVECPATGSPLSPTINQRAVVNEVLCEYYNALTGVMRGGGPGACP